MTLKPAILTRTRLSCPCHAQFLWICCTLLTTRPVMQTAAAPSYLSTGSAGPGRVSSGAPDSSPRPGIWLRPRSSHALSFGARGVDLLEQLVDIDGRREAPFPREVAFRRDKKCLKTSGRLIWQHKVCCIWISSGVSSSATQPATRRAGVSVGCLEGCPRATIRSDQQSFPAFDYLEVLHT